MKQTTRIALALSLVTVSAAAALQDHAKVTYDDTPEIPGTPYRVHGERPRPTVVTPAPGAGLGTAPPSDAVVLFDGSDLAAWTGGKWKVCDGYAEASEGSLTTQESFGDIQLHLEFATPAEVQGSSQGRGNSGVFFLGTYEVQVLDSYRNDTYPDGQCAAMYGQYPPDVNACRAPGEWQGYDIVFHAPRFEGETLTAPARVTVFHNGVLVHDDRAFLGATAHRALAQYRPHAPEGPITLQDHGNPVRYRNIWLRRL